ncbi:glycoside hydrolase family 9 protein [Thiotrichales bacterium 19S11-10]|nr:glycoside hydrolase family 9 protein [Thiotrichales bacterium 19S11-10]
MKNNKTNVLIKSIIFVATLGFFMEAKANSFNYGEALQKSIYFYDVQRAGELPENGTAPGKNRVFWRSDSVLNDGSDIHVDLSGGFFDAGDHGKFGLPMANTFSFLALGAIEYLDAYDKSGQLVYLLENMKWAGDYFVAAHISDNELVAGVGDGNLDHTFWGAPEIVHLAQSASIRESFVVNENNPGSDVAAATSAALSSMYQLFKLAAQLDPQKYQAYYDHAVEKDYLGHAITLYEFADQFRGKYSDSIPSIRPFYNSWSGYQDELVWGSIWLYLATNNQSYLTNAEQLFEPLKYNSFRWTYSWDDTSYGALVLLSMYSNSDNKALYISKTKDWLNFWLNSLQRTPDGLAWLSEWGALRYSANTSLLAFVFADYLKTQNDNDASQYEDFAVSQINYMLGDNAQSRSYVVGFGNNPPLRPHHRGSSGVYTNNINHDPQDNLHVLYGALVGGPSQNGSYEDRRDDYIKNEVALDYNGGFTGALARMYQICSDNASCQPLSNFPAELTPAQKRDEFAVEAKVNAQGSNFREYSLFVKNKTAYPARATEQLSVRYYLNLKNDIANGISPSDVVLRSNGLDGTGMNSQLLAYNEAEGIYYVDLKVLPSTNDGILRPGGQSEHRREIQFRITMPNGYSAHDFTNDWSAFGIDFTNTSNDRATVNHITVFENGQLVFGLLPNEEQTSDEPPQDDQTNDDETTDNNDSEQDNNTNDNDQNNNEDQTPNDQLLLACNVDFTVDSQWDGGYVTQVNLTNQSSESINDWTLQVDNLTSIVNSWNAQFNQNGQTTIISAMSYNQTINANGSVSFGYQGSGSFVLPDSVTLITGSTSQSCSVNGQASNNTDNQSPDDDTTTDDQSDPISEDNTDDSSNDQVNDDQSNNAYCAVTIEKDQWSTGATMHLNVTNESDDALNNWTVELTLPEQSSLSNGWGGQFNLDGDKLNIAPAAWNQTIQSGSSFGDLGFVVSFPGGSQMDDQSLQIKVNDQLCQIN